MSKKMLRRVVPAVATVALTVGVAAVVLSTPAEAAVSKDAQKLCATARCDISYPISAGAAHGGINEGSAVKALVMGSPNTTISLAAFKVDQDAAKKPKLVKVSDPVKITTDKSGRAEAQVTIKKLPVPLTGGEHFVVQPADTTDPGKLVALSDRVSYFGVNSARARYAKTVRQTDHMLTTLSQGLPGDQYLAQLKVGNDWKTINLTDPILGKDNGVVKASTNSALLYWRTDVPAGKYPLRFVNAKDPNNPVYQEDLTVGAGTGDPSKSASPAPSKSASPAPSKSASPAPSKTASPAPSKTTSPAPSKTASPAPSKTTSAAPTPSVSPAPSTSPSGTTGPTGAPAPGAPASPGTADPKVQLTDGIAFTGAAITPSRVAAGERYTYTVEVTSARMSQTKNEAGRDVLIQGEKKKSDFTVTFETAPGSGAATCTATADGGTVDGGTVRFTGAEAGKVTVSCTYHGPGRFQSEVTLTSHSGHQVFGSPAGYTIGVDPKNQGTTGTDAGESRTTDNKGVRADDGRSTEKNTETGGKLAKTGH
ncbi:hypothetical protein [Granulicoccus phenolivorans]|uniref:hypothetical protein n=1 Tax=Granulicoccus phenolivorans TaxID=266854 RepID=UPI00047AA851|nr:hypothetical protein [Granulicoccus phenolivorans]